jgi:hypothetical protein
MARGPCIAPIPAEVSSTRDPTQLPARLTFLIGTNPEIKAS